MNKKLNRIIGKNVKALRRHFRESQTDLGRLLKLHQTALCRVEQGTQCLLPEQLQKLRWHYCLKNIDKLFEPIKIASKRVKR